MWSYNGEEFTSEMIEDKKTKMKYIGKKGFFSKVTKPPLKGKKRKRRSFKESDWKKYCGSSEAVKMLVEENGLDHFDREILYLCKTKGELNYMELREQILREVLLKPDEYHNAFVGGKIHRAHIKALWK
jgi:hypothetical protein